MILPVMNARNTGRTLRNAIIDSGYSASDIAAILGVTNSNVYKWLRGDVLPNIDNLYAISMITNVSINDILA